MEKDDEIKGDGNSYDFGARIYDSRVGRWLSTDPLENKYPSMSPYNFVANMPIIAIDPDGKEVFLVFKNRKAKRAFLKVVEGQIGEKYKVKLTKSNVRHTNVETGASAETYQLTFEIKKGKENSKLNAQGQAFLDNIEPLTSDKEHKSTLFITFRDSRIGIGDYKASAIDMADIKVFNKKKGLTQAGALGHELVEQYEKTKRGLKPGQTDRDSYRQDHHTGIIAENEINQDVNRNQVSERVTTTEGDIYNVSVIDQKRSGEYREKIKLKKEKISTKPRR